MKSAEHWIQGFPIRESDVSSERKWLLGIIKEIQKDALDEACKLVHGHCSSDNEAQRTVDAIRMLKKGDM